MKVLLLTAPMLLALAACTPAAQKVASTPTPAPTPAAPAFVPVAPLSAARVTTFDKAAQVIQPGKSYRAVLHTTQGDVTVDLNAQAAPVAVNNFVFLALNHFYDGTRFHRVIDGFMAQGGDPQSADLTKKDAWGTGGPGYSFRAENANGLRFDAAGVLGMARSASLDSQGSQFFITLAPADFLSGSYTVFGKVAAGQSALDRLTRTSQAGQFGESPIAGATADTLSGVDILVSR